MIKMQAYKYRSTAINTSKSICECELNTIEIFSRNELRLAESVSHD